MSIPFTKAHGAKNDFLLTWDHEAPSDDRPNIAKAICARHTGVGADGWLLVAPGAPPAIRLYNSDGSEAEISGNGTRCAAAFLIDHGRAQDEIRILTGAGLKHLRLLERRGRHFDLEMNMGRAGITAEHVEIEGRDAVLVWVGNPQCAIPVEDFEFDWRALGAEIERHPRFPHRTNVSFLRVLDEHTLEVRFWERGAGETMSSGTGSTGAVAAAIARGLVRSPLTVQTPAGPIEIRVEGDIYLRGPAELVAEGRFLF
jgi:diaminopimelate epimerase